MQRPGEHLHSIYHYFTLGASGRTVVAAIALRVDTTGDRAGEAAKTEWLSTTLE